MRVTLWAVRHGLPCIWVLRVEQVVISIAYGALSILIIGGYRFLARSYFRQGVSDEVQSVVIVGAKSIGLQIMNSLFHGPGFQVIALAMRTA